MDLKNIKKQIELSKNAVSEMKKQNAIFDTLLQEAIKGAPEEHKPAIDKMRSVVIKVKNLAKNGKLQEAQELIKQYQTNYGG